MRKLLLYLKPYWKIVILAPLLMALEVAMDLLQPRLVQQIVDVGIVNQDLSLIIKTGLSMVGFALIGMVGGIGCTIFAVMSSQSNQSTIIMDYSFIGSHYIFNSDHH